MFLGDFVHTSVVHVLPHASSYGRTAVAVGSFNTHIHTYTHTHTLSPYALTRTLSCNGYPAAFLRNKMGTTKFTYPVNS